jgi:hypothetical protein
MPKAITIKIGKVKLQGEFNDTAAGRAMGEALPIECQWSRWGDEYYGTTRPAFTSYPGAATDLMEVGELAYHAQNGWFCLFFGPTPASRGKEPRARAESRQGNGRLDDGQGPRGVGEGPDRSSVSVRVAAHPALFNFDGFVNSGLWRAAPSCR